MRFNKGQTLALIAILVSVLFGAAGLMVDYGHLAWMRARVRNTADATALAAAQDLPIGKDQATETAYETASKNGVSSSELTVTTPYNGNDNQIAIGISKTVNHYFMRILGFQSSEVKAKAVAAVFTSDQDGLSLPNLLPIAIPDTAPSTCRLWGPSNQCNDTPPSGGGSLGPQYKGLVDLRTCDEAAETSSEGFESSFGASNFYIPLKSSTSGTYPSRGTTSDSVRLTSRKPQSSGWLEISWTFEGLPTDVNFAKITMEFQDLDLQGDFFYRWGRQWVSLFETFELKDPDGNTLATLDSSAPYDDNFTWEFDLPTELFTSDTLTLTARLTAEVTRYCCSSVTLTNTMESIQSIKIEGTAGSAEGDSDCTPFDAADDYGNKPQNVEGWIQNGCNCTIYEGNDMALYNGNLGANVSSPLRDRCEAQGLSDEGGDYGLFVVLVYDKVIDGDKINISGYQQYKIYCDDIATSSVEGTRVPLVVQDTTPGAAPSEGYTGLVTVALIE